MYFQDRECRPILAVHNKYIFIDLLYFLTEYMDIIGSMSLAEEVDHLRLFTFCEVSSTGKAKKRDCLVFSMRACGSTPTPLATRKTVLRLGPCMPRSKSLMNVRSKPVALYRVICEIFFFNRALRISSPKARSTPARG